MVRILLELTLVAWLAVEVVLVLGRTLLDRIRGRGRVEDAGSAFLLFVALFLGFLLASRLARLGVGRLPGSQDLHLWVGLLVMCAGLVLRVWAILELGGFFRGVVTIQEDHRLVSSGPYRYVRHPSYTGFLLALVGLAIALGHWTSLLALLAAGLAGIAYRIHVEERALVGALGNDYRRYQRRTKRLLPLLY